MLAGSWALVQSEILLAITAFNHEGKGTALPIKLRHSPACQ